MNEDELVIYAMARALKRSGQHMVTRRIVNEDEPNIEPLYVAVMTNEMMIALMEVMILDPRSEGWDDHPHNDLSDYEDLYDGGDDD